MKFEYEAPPEQAEVARALERDVQITKHAWERMFSRGDNVSHCPGNNSQRRVSAKQLQ